MIRVIAYGFTNNYFAKLLIETKGFLDKRKNYMKQLIMNQ